DGRELTYDYGEGGNINDRASRIVSIVDDDSTHLANYDYLGLGTTVVVDYTEPDVKYTLVDLSGTNDPDTGDIYSGLDRFGRVKDCRWYNYNNEEDVARLKYGYDRASNRLWREDMVARSLEKEFDELYSYDGLHRLKDMARGWLNGSRTALTSETFGQCWALDATGNWDGFREASTGASWTLEQSRTANPVNEITGITNTVGAAWAQPGYDPAGNMTTIPQPADPTQGYTATYDAWNRLVKLTDGSDTVQENEYDARTFRTVRRDYESGDLSESRQFYYTPNWRCIEERIESSSESERQIVWGLRYLDDLVLRDRDTNGNGTFEERLYGCQDGNWNVVAATDTTGTTVNRYAYSAYGAPTYLTAAFGAQWLASDWETLYCGYRHEPASNLYTVRLRFYQPLLGVWTRRDPEPVSPSDSLYTYCETSPVDSIDPSGGRNIRTSRPNPTRSGRGGVTTWQNRNRQYDPIVRPWRPRPQPPTRPDGRPGTGAPPGGFPDWVPPRTLYPHFSPTGVYPERSPSIMGPDSSPRDFEESEQDYWDKVIKGRVRPKKKGYRFPPGRDSFMPWEWECWCCLPLESSGGNNSGCVAHCEWTPILECDGFCCPPTVVDGNSWDNCYSDYDMRCKLREARDAYEGRNTSD
ncbi:MAG: hypothetical protein KF777_23955, partial [Planctomycetaceae bacterium]|nr:hypothetical protein [Planctomycetaceae bacterium]